MRAYGDLSREDRLLLACARISLDDRTRHEIEAAIQDGMNWEMVLERSKQEGISGLLYAHLSGLEGISALVPSDIFSRLGAIYQAIWARNTVLTEQWSEVVRLLSETGVASITHKGMILIHVVYPEIGLRPMADIDLLIRPADLPIVTRTLQAVRFRTPDAAMQAEEAFRGYLHLIRDGVVLDLHQELAHYTRFEGIIRVDHDGLWTRAVPLAVGPAEGLTLSPEDMLLHLALHLTLGSEFGRLLGFTDIDAVVRRFGSALNWERVVEEARRWRVRFVLGYTLEVCQASFGTPIPGWILPQLLPGRLRPMLLRRWLGSSPPSLSRQLGDSRIYLAETLLMDRLRDLFRVCWRSLFPSRGWVKLHYALTSHWQITLHQLLHPLRVCYLLVKHLRRYPVS